MNKKEISEKNIFNALREVFSNSNYIILTGILAFLFYLISINISNFFLFGLSSFKSFMFIGKSIKLSSLITTIIISIFFGILFSMVLYRTKLLKPLSKNPGLLATIGIFLGIFAPGCTACGIGLISALGVGAVTLSLLPLNGLEISILSIILLGIGIFQMSKKINKGLICGVDTNIDERRYKNERKYNNQKI